ncbi:uncharacterized protein IL334_005861 [Kwoniella shivajii]|uniref:RNase III domain-containing protein n=1 Tax=Kwoniella shivajii TaxID=564305 RepID=A0ABZ1D4Q1_9TREE|nr:hypothetical protein IL334_005861 [Kwoniella shivajii]
MAETEKNHIPTSALVLLDNFTYPPLPPILDGDLEKQVFTHKSVASNLPIELAQKFQSYDKLAHIGDSLLNTFITCLLHSIKPESRSNVATNLRSKLTTREINTRIAKHYGLPGRVQCGGSDKSTFLLSDQLHGEVYEAYIAGLFYSYMNVNDQTNIKSKIGSDHSKKNNLSSTGRDRVSYGQAFDRLSSFLVKIYTPLIQGSYDSYSEYMDTVTELSLGAKAELNQYTQKLRLGTPHYSPAEYLWPDWILENDRRGDHGKVWKSVCTVYKGNGTKITKEGIADGVKPAENVAAFLVLKELKGI